MDTFTTPLLSIPDLGEHGPSVLSRRWNCPDGIAQKNRHTSTVWRRCIPDQYTLTEVPTNSTAPPRVLPALVRFEDALGQIFVILFDVGVAGSDPGSRLEIEVLQLILEWSSYTVDQLAAEACILWDIDQVDIDNTVDLGLAWGETVLQPSPETPPPRRKVDGLLPNQSDAVVGAAVDCSVHQEHWYPRAYGESTGLGYWPPQSTNPAAPAPAAAIGSPPLATAHTSTGILRKPEHGRGPSGFPVAGSPSTHEQLRMDEGFGYYICGDASCQSKHVPPVPYLQAQLPVNGYQAQAIGFAPGTWRTGPYDRSWRVGTYTSTDRCGRAYSDGSVGFK
ncbi:hypothetical protein C8Q74DRAFT_531572 [Fomes fomentarius]|nr:hypothetical protein C8Q74DRAFT_531572 [Fomes fomentarius]